MLGGFVGGRVLRDGEIRCAGAVIAAQLLLQRLARGRRVRAKRRLMSIEKCFRTLSKDTPAPRISNRDHLEEGTRPDSAT